MGSCSLHRQLNRLSLIALISLTIGVCQSLRAQETMQVIEESAWEFGLGAGFGERSNIIVGADDIDINAFVHIAYIGEHFFFDNGDIGIYLTESDSWNLNLIAGANSERQFFEHLNQFGFTLENAVATPVPGSEFTDADVVVEETDRDTPIDMGLEWITDGDWGSLQLQLNHEVSGKHGGYEIWSGYNYVWRFGNFGLQPSLGIVYKSQDWTDYFYGVKPDEAVINPETGDFIRAPYSADDALNGFLRLAFDYRFSEHWRLVGVLENEYLDSSIKDSPIVVEDSISTYFVGLYYEF